MPTADDVTDLVSKSLGLALDGGPAQDAYTTQQMTALRDYVGAVAAFFQDIPTVRLRLWYVLRECCSILQGQLRTKISGSLGPLSQQLNQKFTNLTALYKQASERIDEERKRLRASRPVVSGQLLAYAPTMIGRGPATLGPGQPGPIVPPWWLPDPNNPGLLGYPREAYLDANTPANPFPGAPFVPAFGLIFGLGGAGEGW